MDLKVGENVTLKITGIVDKSSPSIYVNSSEIYNILYVQGSMPQKNEKPEMESNASDNKLITKELADRVADDALTLKRGSWPEGEYETAISYDKIYEVKIGSLVTPKVNGQKLKVVGFYTDEYSRPMSIVSKETLKKKIVSEANGASLYVPKQSEKSETIQKLKDAGFDCYDAYKSSKEKYTNEIKKTMKTVRITGLIILAISLIEIYLMMRASFLSRIKEVGIFRAIGVKKTDIYKMFLGEVLAITTVAGIPGFVLMGYIVHRLSLIKTFQYTFLMNPTVAIVAVAIIYVANILFGLLPVAKVLMKTPAAILARTDVD